MKNITLKRILKQHKENPQDADLHEVIENDNVNDKEFEGLVKESTKHEAFDKK
jgi:hypothetical protein